MTHVSFTLTVCIVLMASASLIAEDAPPIPAAEKEFRWLQQFVGQWESEMEASMGPGQPPVQCKGTMDSRMIGDFWVVSEMTFEFMGVTMKGVQTIGFDAAKKKYVGTWVDSMVNYLWHYEGTVDDSGKILTLETEGPNFLEEGKLARFRDVYEFKSNDHIVATSSMLDADVKWVNFMTGEMRRKK